MVKISVNVDGMACGMCESHVNDTFRKAFPDIKKISSSHSKNKTEIITEKDISEEELRNALDPTGYMVLGVTSEPYEKKGFSLFKK